MIRLRPPRTVARTARYLVLALAVCLAQQGALVHAVSHLHERIAITELGTTTAVSDPATTDAKEFCLECLAFAQVASAVLGNPLAALDYQSLITAIGLSGREAEHAATIVFLARVHHASFDRPRAAASAAVSSNRRTRCIIEPFIGRVGKPSRALFLIRKTVAPPDHPPSPGPSW
jgi:hypothetical protein